ncbi:beta-lactamase [Xylariaceae sp. FL1272]|nr:beta-lactamase [Xylariaceae sp. FL1272]
MVVVNGNCDGKFQEVRLLLEQAIASGDELGASIAVNLDGEEVVDIWGGFTDQERTQTWNEDTIVNVWSSTKCVTSLAVLKVVDEGILNVEDKVSKYWPEFAANGKQDILIRHVLSHASGVSGWENSITAEGICDLELSANMLAEQAPWWEPGTGTGYHSVTFGHILSMIIRKATGGKKTLKQIVAEDLARPLEADFQIGALEKDWPRVSPIYPGADFTAPVMEPGSITEKTLMNPRSDAKMADFANTATFKLAEVGSSNGHANARGMNRIMSPISMGGTARGVQILKPETVELIFEEQYKGRDHVVPVPVRFGIGFGLRGEGPEIESSLDRSTPKGKICFWGGWGGSIIIMDLTRKLTITYAMNQMGGIGGNKNTSKYIRAIYAALEA